MTTKDQLVSLGLTEIKADEVMLLEGEMLKRAVRFSYKKKDGSARPAEGTLDPELMVMENGEKWTPKGESKPCAPALFRYFDLGVKDWRCFNMFNLLAVEG